MNSPRAASPPPQQPLLSREADYYYTGLPSVPRLVARSGTIPWEMPSGQEAYNKPKVLGIVGKHDINDVWEGNLCCKVVEYLDREKVAWTSIDVVRIGYAEESFHPVILWIGVLPESLSVSKGTTVAHMCKDIVTQSGIKNVDVEIRESLVTPLAGPKLLVPTFSSDPTVDVRTPLTPTLGFPISSKGAKYPEGTGGLFVAEGGTSKKLFLVTARHVLLPMERGDNNTYDYKPPSEARREVTLLGEAAFQKLLDTIQVERGDKALMIPYQERRLAKIKDVAGEAAEKERKKAQDGLAEAQNALQALTVFYDDVETHWSGQDNRIIGHVVYSPPITFTKTEYTQDFAVIEIDNSKINASNFQGNVIDLGTKIQPGELNRMMHPNIRNRHSFDYPEDRLLRLKGAIPEQEMIRPPALDQHGEPALMVIKNGAATGLTVGRANNVRSAVHYYYKDDIPDYSMEWAILPFDRRSGAFSAPGDSGACVADGRGRIGGIITSGAGWTPEKDITYATPIASIMKAIKHRFPNAHLNPVAE